MLNSQRPRTCVECGLPFGHTDFTYYAGNVQKGPAYWSDQGILCSSACSTAHFARREKEGNPMTEPAQDPFEKRSFFG
jgi:hypothetical protein